MKNENGITMVSLVITILILLMLSTVTFNVGFQMFHMSNMQNFVGKMKVVQSKVDNLIEEKKDIEEYGFTKLSDLEMTDNETYKQFADMLANPEKYNIDVTNSWDSLLDVDKENYYYFEPDDLEKLGLKNQDVTVIINFETRNVIARNGVEYENKMYYRQYDLVAGDRLIK